MKAFFAAIIVLIILAFAFTTLPSDFARILASRTVTESLLKTLREKTLGKNPVEARADLIDEIEGTIQELEREIKRLESPRKMAAPSPSSESKKAGTPHELLRRAEDLLEELRARNAERGLLQSASERALEQFIPRQDCSVCPVRNQQ